MKITKWKLKLNLWAKTYGFKTKAHYIELKMQTYLEQIERGSTSWGRRKREAIKKVPLKKWRIKDKYIQSYEAA